jgi:hypothetical protein
MMPYGYAIYQADRTRTAAEQREVDARLGRLAAALLRRLHSLGRPARVLLRQAGPSRTSRRTCVAAGSKSA